MRIPPGVILDDALFRYLRASGLLGRISAVTPFVARLETPVPALRQEAANPNVVHFGGYRQLAIRRANDERLEVGYVHARRADMVDAAWMHPSARPLRGIEDIDAVRRAIHQR